MRQARAYGSSDALFSDDKTADSAAATDSDAGATNSASQEQDNHEKDGDAAVVNETEDKIAKLEAEVKSLKDQLLRGMAEEENVRRIAKKDVENARLYGIQTFAKTMLDVADNLERAIDAVPEGKKAELANQRKDGEEQGDAMLGSLLEGIIAVEKGLQKRHQSWQRHEPKNRHQNSGQAQHDCRPGAGFPGCRCRCRQRRRCWCWCTNTFTEYEESLRSHPYHRHHSIGHH
eukprot:GSChrysophyteH2.ASY1.ANO1.198.1 assembled CDS